MITLTDSPFDPAVALAQFTGSAIGAGGIVSFSGHVRPVSRAGKVLGLHLQAYEPMTQQGIGAAAEEASARWELVGLRIIHRIGDMEPGDAIVFVAAASKHRRAAFEATDFLMDYLKTKAVFWKKETSPEGSIWIEPRGEDYADEARWDTQERS